MDIDTRATASLSRYSLLEVTGADAGAFLQSQLSADIDALKDQQTVLTGWHDPKGRVLCCIRVVRSESGFLVAVPSAIATDTVEGLGRYILRARVTLAQASDRPAAAPLPNPEGEQAWELAEIRAGIPEVYPATRGLFTGQMLNLDLIGGISFSKGCYPGQEIIARTHHLGRAKRRMQRFVSSAPPRDPGESLFGGDGRRAGQVVRSAISPTGSESLVVAAIEGPGLLTAADGAELRPDTLPYSLT